MCPLVDSITPPHGGLPSKIARPQNRINRTAEPMAIHFENAPLIEVIAELRWGPAFPPIGVGQQFTFDADVSQSEEFFMHFGAECSVRGLQRAERVVPPGFPVMPGQVVYRFRSGDKSAPNLLQVGPGVFTANALPPYAWAAFDRFMREGIDALLSARPASERDEAFATVNLRFVNGFGADFLQGESRLVFLQKLGFNLQSPRALESLTNDSKEATLNLNYSALLGNGSRVNVSIAEGLKDGEPIQILELGVTHSNLVPDKENILEVLSESHAMIEEIFLDMTKKISDIMIPSESFL